MKQLKRAAAATLAVMLAGAGLAVSAAPASAAQAAQNSGRGRTVVLPAAPAASGQRTMSAASPTVSPYARSVHVPAGSSTDCPTGNFCAAVWDYTSGTWEVFYLYNCATYSLSHWLDSGVYWNNQTGTRATATFYGQYGDVRLTVPVGGSNGDYTWDPIWKIRNCY